MKANAVVVMGVTLALFSATWAGGQESPQKPKEILGFGAVVDPDGDCAFAEKDGVLSIQVPGTLHNLNPGSATNAPRVLLEVEGDFVASVKVTGDFKPGDKSVRPGGFPFNGAGLVLWSDAKNFFRLERNIWLIPDQNKFVCYSPLVEYYKGGQYQKTNPRVVGAEFFQGRSTFLRMERTGGQITASYSHDGEAWTVAKEVQVDLPQKLQIGLAVINSSNGAMTVEFSEYLVAVKN